MNQITNYLNILILTACLGSMLSCISEYVAKDVDQLGGMLVVEGMISSGETTVKLSYSVGILEEFTEETYVNNATVYVVSDDGSQSPRGQYESQGAYLIETGDLDLTKQYKLHVSVDGKEYESTYLTPVVTPAVDSVFWYKQEKGAPVSIRIATHDPAGEALFYRWIYEENWKVQARFMARIDETDTYEYDLWTSNNIHYCWGKDSSQIFLLGSAEKLAEARISQKELTQILPTEDKLSVLYHIGVKQYALRKEAYDYFYNLQKNVESTGGIFASMPTELRGNISCLSDPEEYVIGYMEVSVPSLAERYIDYQEGAYEAPMLNCELTTDPEEAWEKGLGRFDKDLVSEESYYARRRCFDCRLSPKASKTKPSWWPTSHL